MMKIGVLAVQGAFVEHEKTLHPLGVETVEVRLPRHIEGLDGLILPGGESTTIGKLAVRWGLIDPIRDFARSGRPLWGICAGMIVMAREVVDGEVEQPLLELMDIDVLLWRVSSRVKSSLIKAARGYVLWCSKRA